MIWRACSRANLIKKNHINIVSIVILNMIYTFFILCTIIKVTWQMVNMSLKFFTIIREHPVYECITRKCFLKQACYPKIIYWHHVFLEYYSSFLVFSKSPKIHCIWFPTLRKIKLNNRRKSCLKTVILRTSPQ